LPPSGHDSYTVRTKRILVFVEGETTMGQEFNASDFVELSPTEGSIRMQAQGQSMELPYKARNYVNKAGTIGYAAVDANDKVDFMFISNTNEGVVLTFPGEIAGPVRFSLEGYKRLITTNSDATIERAFELHRGGLGSGGALADKDWLEKELPGIPRRAGEVLSRLFEEAARLMDGMPENVDPILDAMFSESDTRVGAPGLTDKAPSVSGESDTSGGAPGPTDKSPSVSGESDTSGGVPGPADKAPSVSGESDTSGGVPGPADKARSEERRVGKECKA
jgi:hypothetical protein